MTKAPERIWIHPTEKQPLPAKDKHLAKWLRGKWKDHDGTAAGDVEYVRADLVEALEAENQRLREALKVFANSADGRRRKDVMGSVCFGQDHLLKARAALRSTEASHDPH